MSVVKANCVRIPMSILKSKLCENTHGHFEKTKLCEDTHERCEKKIVRGYPWAF